jgi:molecular chaperone DnaJ
MSAQPDPHAELGVPPGATQAEIHQAFRRRLREHHPDTRTRGDTADAVSDQALQRALAAYQTLRNQSAPPPVEPATEAQPHRPDRPGADGRSGSPGDPAIRVTDVHWVPDAGVGPSHYPAAARTSHGVGWPDWLIRWLLGD